MAYPVHNLVRNLEKIQKYKQASPSQRLFCSFPQILLLPLLITPILAYAA